MPLRLWASFQMVLSADNVERQPLENRITSSDGRVSDTSSRVFSKSTQLQMIDRSHLPDHSDSFTHGTQDECLKVTQVALHVFQIVASTVRKSRSYHCGK